MFGGVMADDIIDEFYELVVGICDSFYANHELITKKAVQKAVCLHGEWSLEQLEYKLPEYINNWRLHNLEIDPTLSYQDKIAVLEAQICKYKVQLQQSQQIIQKLQAQLFNERASIKVQREEIIHELRNLLAK